jgi:hypothetical protein
MAFEFVKKMEGLLELFIAVKGRRPISSDEFANWVTFYEANSRTTNSRGPIMDIYLSNEKNDASF